MGARQYDPQIGRFLSVDPMAASWGQESYSPYAAMGNQPESNIDPNGLGPQDFMLAQAVTPEGGDPSINMKVAQSLMMGGQYSSAGANYHGGGSTQAPNFPPGFRAAGLTGTELNTFWNILDPSVKEFVNDQYEHHERHMQFVRDQTDINNERFNKGYQTGGPNPLGGVIIVWHSAQPYHGAGSNNQNAGSNWYSSGGKANWSFGLTASAVETFAGIARFGSNLKFYGATVRGRVFYGNQYVKTFSISKAGKGLGYVSAGIGLAMDLYGLYEYSNDPNSPNAVSPVKATTNTAMSAYGLWVNPAASIIYFGIDAFYPGGWSGDATHPGAIMDQDRLYQENRAIDPNWKLWPIGSKQ